MMLTLQAALDIEDQILKSYYVWHYELEQKGIASPISGIEDLILNDFIDFRKMRITQEYNKMNPNELPL